MKSIALAASASFVVVVIAGACHVIGFDASACNDSSNCPTAQHCEAGLCVDGEAPLVVGEGEGDISEGEGDVVVGEGEGDVVVGEGEGDVVVGEGEGDVVVGEGEGDVVVGEGEGEGEGEAPCVIGGACPITELAAAAAPRALIVDGNQLRYAAGGAVAAQVFVMNADGTGRTSFGVDSGEVREIVRTATQLYLLVDEGVGQVDRVVTVNLDGTDPQNVDTGHSLGSVGDAPFMAGSGNVVAWMRSSAGFAKNLVVETADGSGLAEITTPGGGFPRCPAVLSTTITWVESNDDLVRIDRTLLDTVNPYGGTASECKAVAVDVVGDRAFFFDSTGNVLVGGNSGGTFAFEAIPPQLGVVDAATDGTSIFWVTNAQLKRLVIGDLSTATVDVLVTVDAATSIAVDGEHVYWTERGRVARIRKP